MARVIGGLSLLAAGLALALYGLFAILYRGDAGGSGDTFVGFGGHEVDADVAGGVALALALVAIVAAVRLLRRRRSS